MENEQHVQDLADVSGSVKPMRFHKFLIYFSLFMGALGSISDGLGFISGVQYSIEGIKPGDFYAVFPSVKALDTFFGIVCLLMAGYYIYVRQQLAHQKMNGPAHLKGLFTLGMLINLAYPLLVSPAMRIPVRQFIGPELLGRLIASAIYLLIIWVYYSKRKMLFDRH